MSEKHRNAQKSMPQSRKLFKYQKRKIRRYLKRVRWRRKRRQYMEDAGTDLVDPRDGCDRV